MPGSKRANRRTARIAPPARSAAAIAFSPPAYTLFVSYSKSCLYRTQKAAKRRKKNSLGNWHVNSLIQLRSGQALNMVANGDVANIGNEVAWWSYMRPNLVGDPNSGARSSGRWFDVTLVLPHVLLRLPYGKDTDPVAR